MRVGFNLIITSYLRTIVDLNVIVSHYLLISVEFKLISISYLRIQFVDKLFIDNSRILFNYKLSENNSTNLLQ